MMNRIILIGNGFDLAHGLKTSYKDFIEDYWKNWAKKLTGSDRQIEEDELCSFQLQIEPNYYRSASTIKQFIGAYSNAPLSANCLAEIPQINQNSRNEKIYHKYTSWFFNAINKAIESKKWVDIEYEYYQTLKEIVDDKTFKPYSTPIKLDEEFEVLKTKLQKYLSDIQKELIKSDLIKDCIRRTIFEPIDTKDISNGDWNILKQSFNARLKESENPNLVLHHYTSDLYECTIDDILKYRKKLTTQEYDFLKQSSTEKLNYSQHIENIKHKTSYVPDYFLLPDQILFLNFNYTSTADLYIPKGSEFKVNHIHGELGNDNNPIIFGYGDELDDDYKEIFKLNDNDYLRNIKSIRYLETNNYRKLLSFINSAPFQIYIMGHSCGNSDRTLLNTLFEHKNCVSIKPFYYEKPDGTDNYIEIVQNISRNFNDMRLMRDRVVNKTYCRPLVPRE